MKVRELKEILKTFDDENAEVTISDYSDDSEEAYEFYRA